MFKRIWGKLVKQIVREQMLINTTKNHIEKVEKSKDELLRGFVQLLWKAMPSYEFASKLIVGTKYSYSSDVPEPITQFVEISKKMLVEYVRRCDPELKRYGHLAYYHDNHKYNGSTKIEYREMCTRDVNFENDWDLLKHCAVVHHGGTIYPPKEILANLKNKSKEQYKELRKVLDEHHKVLSSGIKKAKPITNVVAGNFSNTKRKVGNRLRVYADAITGDGAYG